jgi:hypothetical protein
MSITVVSANVDHIQATIDGATATIPRALLNPDYQRLLSWGMKKLVLEPFIYNAFPSGIIKSGTSLAFVFSSGEGHANSDRQRWLLSNDDFVSFTEGVFVENSTGVYNNSFLSDILSDGEVALFKNVFKVERVGSDYSNTTQSTVVNGVDTYALWAGKAISTGGNLYCTGYRTSPLPTQTALFESTDLGLTWTFVTVIASDASKRFSEAAVVKCLNGDLVAIVREDSGNRDLYTTRCTTGVSTWSAPTILPSTMKGTQPCLLLLANGDVLFLCGDRTGFSGLDRIGNFNDRIPITGVSVWRSTDHGVTWGNATMLAPSWSTDCGQPMAVELDSGMVGVACYLSPGATNSDSGTEPGIYWITFDPDGVV